MRILAIKMSVDPGGTKVAYEKGGNMFIRHGYDNFMLGKPLNCPIQALIDKWGFNEIENPPHAKDGREISGLITKFELKPNNKVSFVGGN